jgi:polar amino acid transport system substrate-binding protein
MHYNVSKLKIFFLVTTLCYPWSGFSDDLERKEVLIGISFSIPPYVIKDKNAGLELEVLRLSLAVKGYQLKSSFLPVSRTILHFKEGLVDAVINVNEDTVDGYYSDSVITFRNYAVSLRKRNIELNSIQDLSKRSVTAFQYASHLLGSVFNSAIQNNPQYNEVADQSLQIKLLFKQRVEVIVLEKKYLSIFEKICSNKA